jgi:hypothetical protein
LEDEGMKQSEAEKQAYFLQDAGEIQTSRDLICHSAWGNFQNLNDYIEIL